MSNESKLLLVVTFISVMGSLILSTVSVWNPLPLWVVLSPIAALAYVLGVLLFVQIMARVLVAIEYKLKKRKADKYGKK